ncbi:hypothetical protein [Nocardioides sp. SYSU D00038]|uniref:hypothetical protein n=1 Tax=Nocardioides sp. SYSU D00038 TaxID=2812554 RepID=UPI00196768CF|nr:hypothetical protein [Nocardioides sp. SYSU D00038]
MGFESHHDDHERAGTEHDPPAPEDEEREEPGEREIDRAGAAGAVSEQFAVKPTREEAEAVERDRAERLDPDNRPDNVEVDNTGRTFDAERGMFTDSEGYDDADAKFPPPGEQGA